MSQSLFAQNVRLFIQKDFTNLKIKTSHLFKNEKDVQEYLKTTQQQLVQKGYLEASFDSVQKKQDSLFTWLHVGKKYDIRHSIISTNKRRKKILANSVYDISNTKESVI